ncbi:unnamed protein product [Vicia faba]|uniref:Uncharacterized protein n=1 Tax=Vicia faba TaxID=3906 RepID=A0AAV1AP38_VICFA|nr:unnamed protein product [Vicia faba]
MSANFQPICTISYHIKQTCFQAPFWPKFSMLLYDDILVSNNHHYHMKRKDERMGPHDYWQETTKQIWQNQRDICANGLIPSPHQMVTRFCTLNPIKSAYFTPLSNQLKSSQSLSKISQHILLDSIPF